MHHSEVTKKLRSLLQRATCFTAGAASPSPSFSATPVQIVQRQMHQRGKGAVSAALSLPLDASMLSTSKLPGSKHPDAGSLLITSLTRLPTAERLKVGLKRVASVSNSEQATRGSVADAAHYENDAVWVGRVTGSVWYCGKGAPADEHMASRKGRRRHKSAFVEGIDKGLNGSVRAFALPQQPLTDLIPGDSALPNEPERCARRSASPSTPPQDR
jgi:hypothetical protein